MYLTPLCPAPHQFTGPPRFARVLSDADSCPVRVRPFSYRVPTILHGRVRRDQIVYDEVDAALGCVFTEPPITLDLPRSEYGEGIDVAAFFTETAHDWTLDGVPDIDGSPPPPNNGVEPVTRHAHLVFLSAEQLSWIGKGDTLIAATNTEDTNLLWTIGGEVHQPAWRDSSVHPSQKWRKHTHVFAYRDDGWAGADGRRDWNEWGWTPRPGQPSG